MICKGINCRAERLQLDRQIIRALKSVGRRAMLNASCWRFVTRTVTQHGLLLGGRLFRRYEAEGAKARRREGVFQQPINPLR